MIKLQIIIYRSSDTTLTDSVLLVWFGMVRGSQLKLKFD